VTLTTNCLRILQREVVDPHKSVWRDMAHQHTAIELLQKDARAYEAISSLLSAVQRFANKPSNAGSGCGDAVSDSKQELLKAIRAAIATPHLEFLT
jgi:hypothetical protein